MDRLNGAAAFPVHPNELKANGHRAKPKPKSSGRFPALNSFVDCTMAGLCRAELAAWLALFRFTDARTGTAMASIETIAERAGTSKRHTLKAVASLIKKRLIERIKTGAINRGSSVYRVHPPPNGASPLVTRRSPSKPGTTGNP